MPTHTHRLKSSFTIIIQKSFLKAKIQEPRNTEITGNIFVYRLSTCPKENHMIYLILVYEVTEIFIDSMKQLNKSKEPHAMHASYVYMYNNI